MSSKIVTTGLTQFFLFCYKKNVTLRNFFGKASICEVSGAVGNDFCTEWNSQKVEVAEEVQQFMARRFVVVSQGCIIENVVGHYRYVAFVEKGGQLFEYFGFRHFIDENDGVVNVATAHEVVGDEQLQLVEEDECAAVIYVGVEVLDVVEHGVLLGQHLGAVVHVYGHSEVVGGADGELHVLLGYGEGDLFLYGSVEPGLVKGGDACILEHFHIYAGTAVQNGRFRSVSANQHVVDAEAYQGGHQVLNGMNFGIPFTDGCAAGGVEDIVRSGFDHRFAGKVGAHEADAGIGRGRLESDRDLLAGVQTLSRHGYRGLDSCLQTHFW